MIPANVYVLQMLERHHRLALSPDSRVPSWQRRAVESRRISGRRRGGHLRLLRLRVRPAHSA
jgi:hypothetical protein